CARSWDGAYW
nr:immunoglobulin heavy chain junction region [Mus musculus]